MNKQTHVEPETRHILPFLAWTFGITWGAWLLQYILTALKLTSGAEPLGFALNFIGGFGPTLGTFISLKISHPKKMLDFILDLYAGLLSGSGFDPFYRQSSPAASECRSDVSSGLALCHLCWRRERRAGLAGPPAAGSGEKILLPSGNCHHGSGLGGLASAPLADSGNESKSDFFALLSLLWYLALFLSGGSLQADGLCLCLHGLSRLH